MEQLSHRKRVRTDSPEFDSTDIKRFREDLLTLLNDSDTIPDRHSDLDSLIRSFEEEISASPGPANFIDLTSDSGDIPPRIDQFPGNDVSPPPESSSDHIELNRVESESLGIGELWEFQDQLPSYDVFELGAGGFVEENSGSGDNLDYLALDGIFDNSDLSFGSDLLWRPETLPAL